MNLSSESVSYSYTFPVFLRIFNWYYSWSSFLVTLISPDAESNFISLALTYPNIFYAGTSFKVSDPKSIDLTYVQGWAYLSSKGTSTAV